MANQQIKLSVHAVTVRAFARPAPARPAAYLQRWAYMRKAANAVGLLIGLWVCPACADTELKIVTPGGYVAFTVGDDWVVGSMQSKLPIATAAFQIPNPADNDTPESTNLLLRLYDPKSDQARAAFDSAVKSFGSESPQATASGPWAIYRQESSQNGVPYTILDAKRSSVGDVSVSVRLAWPHLKANAADYDARMADTFRAFLASVEGKLGAYVPRSGEVTRRPAP